MEYKIIIFSAPSGAGKTTIVKQLLANHKDFNFGFSVSACSRKKRDGETHCVDYYFLTAEEFKQKIANDEFLEWQEVYKDSFYGTLKSEVDRIFATGKNILFDLDVVGGVNVKRIYGEKALSIFVMPPSIEVLEQRLKDRLTETPETIAKRVGKARQELEFAPQFDKIVVNDNLDAAIQETAEVISNFLK